MARAACPSRGDVIADQVKCIDWRGRRAQVKGRVRDDVVERVSAIICRLILPDEQ